MAVTAVRKCFGIGPAGCWGRPSSLAAGCLRHVRGRTAVGPVWVSPLTAYPLSQLLHWEWQAEITERTPVDLTCGPWGSYCSCLCGCWLWPTITADPPWGSSLLSGLCLERHLNTAPTHTELAILNLQWVEKAQEESLNPFISNSHSYYLQ